jgi:hypothetical protein
MAEAPDDAPQRRCAGLQIRPTFTKEETMLLNKSVQFGLAALAQVGLARQAEADAQARHAKDATDSAFDSDFQRKD